MMQVTEIANEIVTPQDAFTASGGERFEVAESVHGFGGLHGGISVALAVATIVKSNRVDDQLEVRSIHAALRRPIRDDVVAAEPTWQRGRTVHSATTALTSRGRTALTVAATLAPSTFSTRSFAPAAPDRPSPERCEEFALPVEFVPFGGFVEIRPTNDARPFVGGPEPTLEAWIRMRDDDTPVDLGRLIVLLDALAPSASATLTDFVAIPTVEFTVRPRPALANTTSPWMLLRATSEGPGDGWVDERLDAWTPDGAHLGSATQLRMITSF